MDPARRMSAPQVIGAVALGLWFGIFPVPGLSTLLLTCFTLMLPRARAHGLSVPESTVALAVNVLATPLCIVLIPMWIKLGLWALRQGQEGCRVGDIVQGFEVSGVVSTLGTFTSCILYGVLAWIALTPLVVVLVLRSGLATGQLPPSPRSGTQVIGRRFYQRMEEGASDAGSEGVHDGIKRRPRTSSSGGSGTLAAV